MRPAVIIALLAAAGCNQIFGLEKTSVRDGGLPPNLATAHLRWLVATTDASLLPVDPVLVPITPPPDVRVGAIGGGTTPVQLGADGEYVYELTTEKWRFIYTLPGDVPREVQWNPAESSGEIVVPLFGRNDRAAPPTGSGYRLTPTVNGSDNLPPINTGMRLYTVGLWTQSPVFLYSGTNDIAFAGLTSLSGRLGAPEIAEGDAIVIQRSVPDNQCSVSGGAALGRADLMTGSPTPVTPLDYESIRNITAEVSHESLGNIAARLQAALGNRQGTIDATNSRFEYGRLPSFKMPGFTQPPAGQLLLPTPLLVPFANCGLDIFTTPSFVEPASLSGLPRGLHAQLVSTRTPAGGPGLPSGLQELVTSTGQFTLSFNTKLAVAPIMLGTFDLATAPDDDPVTLAGPTTLTFALSTQPNAVADYFDITVYRLDGASLQPVRIYTVTEPTVVIDPQDFSSGLRYVLEIRSHSGYPKAAIGDFSDIQLPLSAATVYTRTFIAN